MVELSKKSNCNTGIKQSSQKKLYADYKKKITLIPKTIKIEEPFINKNFGNSDSIEKMLSEIDTKSIFSLKN